MTDQLFINDRVKSTEHQEVGFIVGKFRSKKYPWNVFYAVEFDMGEYVNLRVYNHDGLEKLPDLPDPPPVKAKVY